MADQWDSIPSAPVVQKAPSWDTIPATTNPPIDTTSVNPPTDNSPFTDASHTELKRSYLGSPDRSLVLYKGKPVEDANPFPNNDNFGYFGNKAYHLLAGALNDPFSAATLAYGRLKGFIHPDEIPKVTSPADEVPKDIPLPEIKPPTEIAYRGGSLQGKNGKAFFTLDKDEAHGYASLAEKPEDRILHEVEIPKGKYPSNGQTTNGNIPETWDDIHRVVPNEELYNVKLLNSTPVESQEDKFFREKDYKFGEPRPKSNPLKPRVKLNKDGTYTNLDTGAIVDSTGKDVSAYPEGLRTSKGKVKLTFSQIPDDPSLVTTPTINIDPIPKVEPVNVNSGEMPNVAPPNQPPPPNDFTVKDWWNNPKANRVADVLNVPKSMQTTLDLSAPLRQGRALAHKKEFWTSLDDMFKSAGSEEGYQVVNDSIKATPKFEEAANSGLSFTDLSDNVGKREEQFGSKLAEAIPGYGKLVRGSGRAYTGFLNKLRMDVYQNLATGYEKAGIAYNPQHLADFINTASGRGRLFGKEMEQAAPFLNNYIYSPRLIASRVRMLNPVTYVNADPLMRKEYLKSMFSLIGSTALLGKIANTIPGVSVSANPTSSDFGKVKVGNTRHDLMGGFQQYVVLLSKLASKQLTSTSGKVIPIDSGKYGAPTTFNTLADFGRNKLAPIPSAALNSLAGKDPLGNDTNAFKEAGKLFVPMLVQDIYDIYKDDPSQLANAIPDVFGDSVQTYGTKPTKQKMRIPRVKF